MKHRHRIASLFLLAVPACALPPSQAEQATYQAIAPAHRAYVEADATLDPAAKQRRVDLLEAWRIRAGVAK